jgi:hypothetical protein
MRVLLRDTRTGLFFRGLHDWTAEVEQAFSFRHSAEAMDLAREHAVENAEVLLSFEQTDQTVALPLP